MKVTLINHSDTLGGASVVTYRLLKALRAAGVDARMLVKVKNTDDPYVAAVGTKWQIYKNFIGEHLSIFLHNGFSRARLFKASIATHGIDINKHPWIKDADIVVLNWINQGMLSLHTIVRIKAPVVWTMHDMWNMTGICHHAEDCNEYTYECAMCPLLHSKHAYDLAWSTFDRKHAVYIFKTMYFVAVSSWLKEKSKKSRLLRKESVSFIPNAFPVDEFRVEKKENTIVMGAARLDDDIKDFPKALAALNALADMRNDFNVVFYGALRNTSLLKNARFPYKHLGMITDIASVYAPARIVLSTSRYETLPGTLIEGMASGCIPVTTGHGGQSDIVDHMVTGYIADDTVEDVTRGLNWALDNTDITTEQLVQTVTERFSASKVAQQYITLFENILKSND